jgi:phage tail-like protein
MDTPNKYAYVDQITPYLPEIYLDREVQASGVSHDISYVVLGKILYAAMNASGFLSVSTVSAQDLRQYFMPGNELTRVSPNTFEEKILKVYNKTFNDFETSSAFAEWVSGTLIPSISLNSPSSTFVSGVSANVSASVSSTSAVHSYLIENLGFLYFLNSSGLDLGGDANQVYLSATPSTLMVENLYFGKSVTENETTKKLFEYFWNNRDLSAAGVTAREYLPDAFASGDASVSSIHYLSGTQQLSGLLTHIDVWCDKNNKGADFMEDSLSVMLSSNLIPTKFTSPGPLHKFLKAVSYGFFDVDNTVDGLQDLIDPYTCPPQFLEYLASLVGWKFLSRNVEEWREQLRYAVQSYKMKGSTSGLNSVLGLLFDEAVFMPTSGLSEVYESYLPNLIYYTLKTDSFLSSATSTEIKDYMARLSESTNLKINYDPTNDDTNIRFLVDAILEYLDERHKIIEIQGTYWRDHGMWQNMISTQQEKGFWHRGALVNIPPWEDDKFYAESFLSEKVLFDLSSVLVGGRGTFGMEVPEASLGNLMAYLKTYGGVTTEPKLVSDNSRFRFYTEGYHLPYNVSGGTSASGFDKGTTLADYFNTKSSHMIFSIDSSSTDFTTSGYGAVNTESLDTIHRVFQDFTPLHVTIRTGIISPLVESWDATSSALGITAAITDWDSVGNYLVPQADTSGWMLASGVSGASITSGTLQRGRYVNNPNHSFWGTWGNIAARSNARSRDLKRVLPGVANFRDGKSEPIPGDMYHHVVWSSVWSSTSANIPSEAVTAEIYPKGFNFSSNTFFTTSGIASSIYDTSNTIKAGRAEIPHSTKTYYSGPVSSWFPSRAFDFNVASGLGCPTRDLLTREYSQMVDVFLNRAKRTGDRRYLNLNLDSITTAEFGQGMHKLWRLYKSDYSSDLINSPSSILSHTYGPMVPGDGSYYSGVLFEEATQASSVFTPGKSPGLTDAVSSSGEYKYLVGGESLIGTTYINYSGTTVSATRPGLVSQGGLNTNLKDIDYYPGEYNNIYSNSSIVSGVEMVCGNDTSDFAVLNFSSTRFSTSKPEVKCISLIQTSNSYTEKSKFKLRYCFTDGGLGRLFPERRYSFKFDVENPTATHSKLGIRVTTGFDGTASAVDTSRYVFNFNTNRWDFYTQTLRDSGEYDKVLKLPAQNQNTYILDFHTLSGLGPRTEQKTKLSKKHSEIHSSTTQYYLEIFRLPGSTSQNETNLIHIHSVIGIDEYLSELVYEDYLEKDTENIFRFFDTLSTNNQSRNAIYASGTHGGSGGARTELLEYYGGPQTQSNAGGVTTYNITE